MWTYEVYRSTDYDIDALWNGLIRFQDWPLWMRDVRAVQPVDTSGRSRTRLLIDHTSGTTRKYCIDQFYPPSRFAYSYQTGLVQSRIIYSFYQKPRGSDISLTAELTGTLSSAIGLIRGHAIGLDLADRSMRFMEYVRNDRRRKRAVVPESHLTANAADVYRDTLHPNG